jgi:hypothetical protein
MRYAESLPHGANQLAMKILYMKHLTALLFAALLADPAMAQATEFRCLISIDAAPPIRLQFDFPQSEHAYAAVRYQRGSKPIQLRALKTSSVEMTPGRPFEFTTIWQEPGKNGGTYTVATQGALINEFTYLRGRDKKTFRFEEDMGAIETSRCTWKK